MAGGSTGGRLTMPIIRRQIAVDPPVGTFLWSEVFDPDPGDLLCDPRITDAGSNVWLIPYNVLIEFKRDHPRDPDVQLACMLRGIYLYIVDTTGVASTTVAVYNATVL